MGSVVIQYDLNAFDTREEVKEENKTNLLTVSRRFAIRRIIPTFRVSWSQAKRMA